MANLVPRWKANGVVRLPSYADRHERQQLAKLHREVLSASTHTLSHNSDGARSHKVTLVLLAFKHRQPWRGSRMPPPQGYKTRQKHFCTPTNPLPPQHHLHCSYVLIPFVLLLLLLWVFCFCFFAERVVLLSNLR